MVFWAHSLGFHAWGGSGVWLFFMLSGFLLFRPFVRSGYVLQRPALAAYAVRRLLRIWPLLLVAVPVYALFVPAFGGWKSALEHAFFIRADLHFWTVKQELLFYLVLPLFVLACRAAPRHALVVLAVVAAMAYMVFDIWQPVTIAWQGIGLKFRVVPFVIGMAAAVLAERMGGACAARGPAGPKPANPLRLGRFLFWFGACGTGVASSSWCYRALRLDPGFFEWEHPWVLWPFLLAFLLGAFMAPNRWVTHPVICRIGTLGYGIYIWHFGVLLMLQAWMPASPLSRTLLAAAITVLLAAASYRWVEAPAMALGRRWGRLPAVASLLPAQPPIRSLPRGD